MFRPNTFIMKLILSDFFLQSGWGILGPVYAIFIVNRIEGGTIGTVGLAIGIYWISKATIQPFVSHYMDVVKGEEDDLNFLMKGLFVLSITPLGFILATSIWHVFLIELIRGMAMACVLPAWMGLFTRHIDKDWEAFSWGIRNTFLAYSMGIAAIFGGFIAEFIGFDLIFVFVSLSSLVSAISVYHIKRKMYPLEYEK